MTINELKLLTRNINEQIQFYHEVIGLKLIERTESSASFSIGKSVLSLISSDDFLPYHFAINIPSNQFTEALKWLKQRVNIIKYNDIEIQEFNSWNAKAIYFYDNDKNLVEFIARKNLNNLSNEKFNSKSLLEISEIGVPVNDIEMTYNSISKIIKLPIYDGGFDRFCAIGNETGLFICINKNVKDWFPTAEKAHSSKFELDFQQNGSRYKVKFENEKFTPIS